MNRTDELQQLQNEDEARLERKRRYDDETFGPMPETKPPPRGGFRSNERVRHQKFGKGTVLATGAEEMTVAFDKAGLRHVDPISLEHAIERSGTG